MQEKIKLKFGFDVDYKYSANMVYKVIKETFGEPTQDAHNLELLCQDIKKNFTEFYFKSQFDKENKLQSIFFSTPSMRKQYDKYSNLLIIDTTFKTNRFHMPLMIGALVNNMGGRLLLSLPC